jgi:hypothetical protein
VTNSLRHGFRQVRFLYEAELTADQLVGGVFSALSVDRLPPPESRQEFAAMVHDAVGPDPLTEHVQVWLQFGRTA